MRGKRVRALRERAAAAETDLVLHVPSHVTGVLQDLAELCGREVLEQALRVYLAAPQRERGAHHGQSSVSSPLIRATRRSMFASRPTRRRCLTARKNHAVTAVAAIQ